MKCHHLIHEKQFEELPDEAFIRLRQLLNSTIIPFSAATTMRRVSEGSFPAPINLSTNIKAWRVGDLRRWLKDPENFRAPHQAAHESDK
mgnify:CR=1 FL=1